MEQRSKEQRNLIKAVAARIDNKKKKAAKAERKKWLSEFILFKILDDMGQPLTDEDGKVLKNTEFKVARKNINLITVMDYIKMSPFPEMEIDFFVENETNEALYLDELRMKATPPPSFYTVIPVFNKVPIDVRDDVQYDGQAILIVHNVPLKCVDESMDVDPKTLREWILFAVMEVDPSLDPYKADVAAAKAAITPVARKMKETETMNFREVDGTKMQGKRLVDERRMIIEAYQKQIDTLNEVVAAKEAKLEEQVQRRRRIGIEFDLLSVNDVARTASYHIRIFGVPNAADVEDRLVAKHDWGGIKLAMWCPNPPMPCWVGRGRVPVLGSIRGKEEWDYSGLEVRVAGCQFVRTPHGVGTKKMLDRKR